MVGQPITIMLYYTDYMVQVRPVLLAAKAMAAAHGLLQQAESIPPVMGLGPLGMEAMNGTVALQTGVDFST